MHSYGYCGHHDQPRHTGYSIQCLDGADTGKSEVKCMQIDSSCEQYSENMEMILRQACSARATSDSSPIVIMLNDTQRFYSKETMGKQETATDIQHLGHGLTPIVTNS